MTAVTYVPFAGSLERLYGRFRQTAKEVYAKTDGYVAYPDLPGYSQECSQFRRRVLKTLSRWELEIDEALFLAGAPKGPILAR